MDDGIGAALETALRVCVSHGRQSGRTSRMIERAVPGDIIVVEFVREQRRLAALLQRAGKKDVRVFAFEPRKLDRQWHRLRNAPVHFDHGWVQAWYQWRLDQLCTEMLNLSRLSIHTRKHDGDIRHADLFGAITWLSGERPLAYGSDPRGNEAFTPLGEADGQGLP